VNDLIVYEKSTCTTCRKMVKLLKDPSLPEEALLDALAEHPNLLQRPIVQRGGRRPETGRRP